MKKFLLIACMALLGVYSASAQNETFKNLQWEAVVGLNSSDIGGMGNKIGFHLGAKAEMALPSIAEGIYANAGAFISLKGCKQDYGDLGNGKTNAYYLEIPIHIGSKHYVNENLSIYGEVGPYIAYGIGGKMKSTYIDGYDYDYDYDYGYGYDYDYDIESSTSKIDTFGDGGLKRFDIGAGIRVGVELKNKYTFSLGYDWGFVDIYKKSDLDFEEEGVIDLTPSAKNSNLTISIGYKI